MIVRPPDRQKFEAAMREADQPGQAEGAWDQFWGRHEGDPALYIVGGKWQSHEAMHRWTDKVGPDFNAKAGTEGVEWQTMTWEIVE
jgi:hypothetical protein